MRPQLSVPSDHPESTETTRLAPSPTGALHLGNARTFLINWALARAGGWRVVLRVEDLDTPRVKRGAVEETVELLRWLGLDWDEGPLIQSESTERHRAAAAALAQLGHVYPCALTRSEIEAAASAPHDARDPGSPSESRFDPALRPEGAGRAIEFGHADTNWRVIVDGEPVEFEDGFAGGQSHDLSRATGDFVIWTKRGLASYQLACCVDDAAHGVTRIVRGDDLLDSAARQLLLWRLLELGPEPSQIHLPLVRGGDGKRLAKRHGDTRLTAYRDAGVPAEAVIGLIDAWSGVCPAPEPMDAVSFARAFDLGRLPRGDVTFTEEDDRWLRSCARP